MGYTIIGIIAFVSGFIVFYYTYYDKRKKLENLQIDLYMQKDKLKELHEKLERKDTNLEAWKEKLQTAENKVVSFQELQAENRTLKTDLKNIDIERNKLALDRDALDHKQTEIACKTDELGQRYLNENVKWIGSKLTPINFVNSKAKLQKVIESCRKIDFAISNEQEGKLLEELKAEYEKVLRADFERQEQARIKAQIREEQKLEREVQKELDRLNREREAIQIALEKALQAADDKHSAEIESLRARLAEAEERSERAISQAQLTKSGHVYVISNIGSFGKDIYKIGMTRRLEPVQRVKELSSASVPFPYDVHMMISCDDAPSLENTLHKTLHQHRLNRVNLRKEFFQIEIDRIRDIVEENHGEVSYVADPEALEYYQSQEVSNEDYKFIEQAYNSLEDEENEEIVDD